MPHIRFIDPQFAYLPQINGDQLYGVNNPVMITIDEYDIDALSSGYQTIGNLGLLTSPIPGPSGNHYGQNWDIFFSATGSENFNQFRLIDTTVINDFYGTTPVSQLQVLNGTIEGGSFYGGLSFYSPFAPNQRFNIQAIDKAPTILNVTNPGTVELGTNASFTFSILDSIADGVTIRTFATGTNQVANFGRSSAVQDFTFTMNTSGLSTGTQDIDFTVVDSDGFHVPHTETITVVDTTAPSFVNNYIQRDYYFTELDLLNEQHLGSVSIRDIGGVNAQFISGFFETKGETTLNQISDTQVDFSFTLTKGYELQDGYWNNTLLATDDSGNQSLLEFRVNIENSAPEFIEDSFNLIVNQERGQIAAEVKFLDSTVDTHTAEFTIYSDQGVEVGSSTMNVLNSPFPEDGLDFNGNGFIDDIIPGHASNGLIFFDDFNLTAGDYTLEIAVTDNDGATSTISREFSVESQIDHTLLDSTYSNTIDITQDNLIDSRFERLITNAMVYGSSEYDVEGVEIVFISDDAGNLMEATSKRVIQRDYNRDGFDDLRIYIGRSDLADIATVDSQELFLSGTNSLGETFVTSGLNGADFELV